MMSTRKNRNGLIKWLVLLGDIITYFLVLHLDVAIFPEYLPHTVVRHVGIVGLLGVVSLSLFCIAIPTVIHRRRVTAGQILWRNFVVVMLSQATFAVIWHLITVESSYETIFNIIMASMLFVGFAVVRFVERWVLEYMRSQGRNTRSVIFVGNDPANLAVYEEIMADPTTGYVVLGYYSNDVIADAPEGLKKLGDRAELAQRIREGAADKLSVDDIFCSLSHSDNDEIRNIIHYCDREVVRFYYVPRMLQNMRLSLKPEMIGDSLVFTNMYEPMNMLGNRMMKRTFDIVVSMLVLAFLLPFIPIIWLIIHIQSPGPLFFRQERTGMNGKNFMVYKFRSMHVNKDADRLQATKDDPRKFAFGNFMRKSNIDELPQFLNVLKGDMSIVGPRPHMTLHTEQYSALIEKYMVRHFAKPGITGWAQVTGFRGETEELWQMEGRIKKDIWYIENWSIWLDIKICFMTAFSMFVHDENAY